MIHFRKTVYFLLVIALLASCKHKKKKVSLAGEDPIEVKDFIASFPDLSLPFQYGDSSLFKNRRENDSLLIGASVFNQFVPDSLLRSVYGKNNKLKIYPLGKIVVPRAETYLLVKTISPDRKAVFLLVFDRKQQFVIGMPALRPDQSTATTQSLLIDRRYTITKSLLRKNADGTTSEGKDVFAYNYDARNFSLIMTDALEDKVTELINPIDTLPKKNKWSADYTNGKMNLVSIRDGRRSDRLSFFIHFEKGKDCSGELKGEATIRNNSIAEYNRDGDPCKLKFIFTNTTVTLSEEEGCGSYRPLNCSFNERFTKKKEAKKKKKP